MSEPMSAREQLTLAADAVRESLDFPAEYMEPAYRHGVMLYEHGQYEEAGKVFGLLAACETGNPVLWKALGSVHKVTGKHDEAVAAFGLAVSTGGTDPWIPVHAAECLLHLRRFKEATAALEHAELVADDAGSEAAGLKNRIGALKQTIVAAV